MLKLKNLSFNFPLNINLRTSYLFIMLGLISFSSYAQYTISGKVINLENSEPLSFAEIVLLSNNEEELIIGDIASEVGEFVLKAKEGNYILKIYHVGQVLQSQPIELVSDINLGDIEVSTTNQLNDVVVIARKRIIERKVDRLVFNVENTMKSSGGDALEILKVTPGVQVTSNDAITMIGKSTISVMVNDKIVKIPEQDISNFLKSIASEDIKSIEVITTPPSQYEAAGNSGMINIQLKESRKNSWNSLVRATYLQRIQPASSFLGTFKYNKNKVSISSSVFYRNGIFNKSEQDIDIFFADGLWSSASPYRLDYKGISTRFDINYKLSSNWTIGAQYIYNKTTNEYRSTPTTLIYDNSNTNVVSSLSSKNFTEDNPSIHTLNLYNELVLDTIGRKITVNLDYFKYKKPDLNSYDGVSVHENPPSTQFYQGININNQEVENVSGKIDIEYPTDWINLSFGAKATHSNSANGISAFNSGLVDDPITGFTLDHNDFEYKEDIQALYISGNKKLNDKLEIQVGFRLETTQTDAISQNTNMSQQNDYSKLFPTAYLSYTPSEKSNFSVSYSKRISRPLFNNLNPNVYFLNPFQSVEGNPLLQPAFIDNFELSYTYGNLSSKLFYSYEENVFGQVPIANPETNVLRFQNKNYIDNQAFGLSENYVFNKFNWWTSNNSVDLYYQKSEFNLAFKQAQLESFGASFTTSNDFILTTDRTFSLNMYYAYFIPGQQGIYNLEPNSIFNLSLQKTLLDKNLIITLRSNDIFKTRLERLSGTVDGIFQKVGGYYDSQSIEFSVSYKFGNKDISAKRATTGNSEERRRTGN